MATYTMFGKTSITQISNGELAPRRFASVRSPEQIADDFLAITGLTGKGAASVRKDIIAREVWLANNEEAT
jgi:hypothetical protein